MGIRDWLFGKDDEVNPSKYSFENPYDPQEHARTSSLAYAEWLSSLDLKVGERIPGTKGVGRLVDPISGPYHVLVHRCGAEIAFTSRSPVNGEIYKCPHCGGSSSVSRSGDTFVFR